MPFAATCALSGPYTVPCDVDAFATENADVQSGLAMIVRMNAVGGVPISHAIAKFMFDSGVMLTTLDASVDSDSWPELALPIASIARHATPRAGGLPTVSVEFHTASVVVPAAASAGSVNESVSVVVSTNWFVPAAAAVRTGTPWLSNRRAYMLHMPVLLQLSRKPTVQLPSGVADSCRPWVSKSKSAD